MLNFNKKKYVSFDNLKSFNGLLQSSLKEKIDGYKSEINVKVDERFKVLSGQQQTDSEVIDAREGQVSLSENLKTYVKKEEFVTKYEYLNEKFTSEIEEMKPNINENTEYINTNKSAIQGVIDFVNAFRCEFSLGEIGYIKLPEVLSGAMIQWGKATNEPNNREVRIVLPKEYSERIFNVQYTGGWGLTNDHYWVNAYTDNRTYITAYKNGSSNSISNSDSVFWFTIGK